MAEKDKLIEIVGAENFFDDPKTLEKYSSDHSFAPPRKPFAVVKPRNAEEVGRIVSLANEDLIPLIPHSSGFPKFHGDTIPKMGGVAVDLSGLKEVIRVDRRNRLAIIEPGVTFNELRSELEKEGMLPYTPLLPRSNKSVLASYLEREPTMRPKDHWDVQDPLLAGEVILGTGDIFRTGGAAQATREDAKTGEVVPVGAMGPGQVDVMRIVQGSQGTMGIVSWASIRCRLKPSIQKPFFVASQRLDDMVPFAYRLLRHRLGEEFFILNDFGLANVLVEEAEKIKELQSALPPWILFVNIAGYQRYPDEKVAYIQEQIANAARELGLELIPEVGGVGAEEVLDKVGKAPEKDRRLRYKGSCQGLPFLATLDKTPEIVGSMIRICGVHRYPSLELGVYIQPIIQGCHCHCEFDLMYDLEDAVGKERVRSLFEDAAQQLANIGASYSRPYGTLADITYRRDSEATSALRKVKGIFDPNNVMNPGKLCF